MVNWLFPVSCPCHAAAKAWIEQGLHWLSEEFDDHAFNGRPIVLPTPDFFPDPYDGSNESVRALLNRVCGFSYDNELLTDLTVVFFGLGIFLGNTPRNWDSQYKKWPGTSLNRPEYMTPPMFGYALAHLAWFRDEERPAWAKHLHWNARPGFRQGLRFLQKVGDSAFKPKRLRSNARSL